MDEEKENKEETQEEEMAEEVSGTEPEKPAEKEETTFSSFQFGKKDEGERNKKVAATVGILLLLVIIGWFGIRRLTAPPTQEPASPTSQVLTPIPTSAQLPDKSEFKIQVLNGTGASGEAALLKKELEDLGFADIEVGNADKSDYEAAEATFSSGFPQSYREEIISELKKIYTKVEEKTGLTGDFDVSIITGLRVGVTPKPTATPTPKTTAAPTPTGTVTPTPTATPTPTP